MKKQAQSLLLLGWEEEGEVRREHIHHKLPDTKSGAKARKRAIDSAQTPAHRHWADTGSLRECVFSEGIMTRHQGRLLKK